MKAQLKLEELAMFGASILLFSMLPYAWWWFPALILLPDVGMLGYLFGTRAGAVSYNLFHHKGLALVVLALGYWLQDHPSMLAGTILFGHASMDRVFGYGLKYPDSFKHTHLGVLE